MASGFPQVGVEAVVVNAQQYQQALQQMSQATTNAGNQIKAAASNTQAMDKATSGAINTIKSFVPQMGQAQNAIEQVGEAFGASGEDIAALAVPIAVAAAALAGFFALAVRGAGFSDIENGFYSLTAAVHVSANALLTNLHTASKGTIDDISLMTDVNRILLGVNEQLGESFGKALPQLMGVADAAAKATGQDTQQVFDSITEAIKRGQTRMLQSVGIIIDQKKAYEDYAAQIGVTAKSLDKTQQSQALLNAVLKQGTQITNELGNAQESNQTKMEQAGTTITNTLNSIASTVQPLFSSILDIINNVLNTISDAVNAIAPYVEILFQIISQAFNAVVSALGQVFGPISSALSAITSVPGSLAKGAAAFFDGAANVIGALAGGITYAENAYVYPAVISIANLIASFLSGLSPPPQGPLHTIDQGGANVMAAWVEGFTGVSLEPITQVAADVNAAMGTVANESLAQVKAQLLSLDNAIAPFQEQLDLVKSQFDSIDNVAKPAIDAIDKQIALAQSALAQGSTTAAEQIKTLDAQKQKLQDYVDTQQLAVDNAQIQLALAQAQQATERAALTTREDMLKQTQSLTTVEKAPKVKKPKGGGGGGATGDEGGAPLDLGAQKDQTSVQQAGADLGAAYQAGFDSTAGDTGTAIAAANQTQLTAAGNKISSAASHIGDKITSAFNGISTGITDALNNASKAITDWVNNIPNTVSNLGNQINLNFVVPFETLVFNVGEKIGEIPAKISDFVTVQLPAAFSTLGAWLENNVALPFSTLVDNIFNFFSSLKDKLVIFFTVTLPAAFSDLASKIGTWLSEPFSEKVDDVRNSVENFFNGEGSGTLHGIFDQVMTYLGGIPDKVAGALKGFINALVVHVVDPVIDALNSAIDAIAGFINGTLVPAINSLLNVARQALSVVNPLAASGVGNVGGITLGHIAYPTIGAATGGVFSGGLLKVGEKGTELVSSASPIGVFPHEFVTALDRLTTVLTRPTTASGSYNNTSNYYNNSTINANGLTETENAIRRMAQLNAMRPR